MKFNYTSRTKDGKIKTGTIEASNQEAAIALLQKYEVFVTSLKEVNERSIDFKNLKIERKVSIKELSIFSRQLAVMLESRVPVMQSLSSLALQSNKAKFKKTILEIAGLVEEGISLSEAFSRYPKIFNNFYVNLIRSGEVSGKISETLYYIASHLESEHETVAQVQQAMIYPSFTIAILFVVVNVIIVFLLPKIQELIKASSTAPSSFTLFMLSFYTFLGNWWWLMIVTFLLAIISLVFYFRTAEGKKIFDQISLKIPFLGDILRKVFLTRFCGNISTLLAAGISINKALKITQDTVNNNVYKKIIAEIEAKVSEGEKMSSVLVSHPEYFPVFVIQMIKVGEQTGKLDKVLVEVVNFYQKEVKRAVDLFLTLLEPMLIIVLGVVVGFLAISVFAPLYSALGTV